MMPRFDVGSIKAHISSIRIPATLAGLTIVHMGMTFIYQWYPLVIFGAGNETDALIVGMVVPQLLLAIISGSLSQILVPLLSNKDDEVFHQDAWTYFQLTGIFFLLSACLLAVTARFWLRLLAPGFSESTLTLAVSLTRIQLIACVCTAMVSVCWAANYAKHKFIWVEASTVLASIGGLIILLLVERSSIYMAAWALVAKAVCQLLFLFSALGKYHLPAFKSDAVYVAWRKLKPMIFGATYYKTDQLADRFLASMAPPGHLSLFWLAQTLYNAGNQVLNKAIASPMLPLLANLATANDWISFKKVLIKRFKLSVSLAICAYTITLFFGLSIFEFLLLRGKYDLDQIQLLWVYLLCLFGSLIGGASGQVLTNAFYSYGDTTTATKIGTIGFTVGLFLKALGFWLYGLVGVGIATSLYILGNSFGHAYFLNRHISSRIELITRRGMQ